MDSKQKISQLYKKFSLVEGSQHIASEYAIRRIWSITNKFKVSSILEVGLGIGSISGILLKLNDSENKFRYSGTEANEFCLSSLPRNIGENYRDLRVYESLNTIPAEEKYDLIIIDGKDSDLKKVQRLLNKHGIILIEGDRKNQLDMLKEIFPDYKFVHLISISKNKAYSPFPDAHWQGGLKVIFVNPTHIQKQWILKEKIWTALKRRIRNFENS